MPSRRSLLIAGGATLLVIGAGSASVTMRDAPTAREPWSQAGQRFDDARLDALAFAILAPNPHNRQPWWVRLDGEDRLTLFCDLDRRLPQTDPFDRQITIGLGAFLELLRMAAQADGHRLETTLFPLGDGEPRLDQRPVANVRFVRDPDAGTDPLFAHVTDRRTVRAPFRNDRPVSTDDLGELDRLAGAIPGVQRRTSSDAALVETVKPHLHQAWHIEYDTSRTHAESLALTRIGAAEVAANPDGISLYGPIMEAWHGLGLLSHANLTRTDSLAARGELEFYDSAIGSTQAFAWLETASNDRVAQIYTGAAWLRTHLAATAHGLAFHPLSQALQEFPEMADVYNAVHALLGVVAPSRIQGLFRLGYVDSVPRPAPRWPMETRLMPLA